MWSWVESGGLDLTDSDGCSVMRGRRLICFRIERCTRHIELPWFENRRNGGKMAAMQFVSAQNITASTTRRPLMYHTSSPKIKARKGFSETVKLVFFFWRQEPVEVGIWQLEAARCMVLDRFWQILSAWLCHFWGLQPGKNRDPIGTTAGPLVLDLIFCFGLFKT